MAAWIPKTAIQTAKNQNVYAATHAIQSREYVSKPYIIKNPTTAKLKRGTGGRSSFNGIVCTVFGCNGFVGRVVCNRLGKIGTQLILPFRGERYLVQPLKLCGDLGQVLFHPLDLNDEESIIKCCKYSNVVINLIGNYYETNNFNYYDVHVDGARRLARIAKECNVERFIHMSCLNVAENPIPLMLEYGSEILRSKWKGEEAVKSEFPEATIIRPSTIYGEEDAFINHYLHPWRQISRKIPLWRNGEYTEKQPVYVSDVASGIVAIMLDRSTAGQTYQFVGPKRYKLNNLIQWIMNIVGQNDKETTYGVADMKYNPLFKVKVGVGETLGKLLPTLLLNWEILEHQHTSDTIYPELPTLEDLGITPASMEQRIPWVLKSRNAATYLTQSLGEMVAPAPPETVETK